MLAASCTTQKSAVPYFTDIAAVQSGEFAAGNFYAPIKPDDELLIQVSSADPAATEIYNLPTYSPAVRANVTVPNGRSFQTYRVDSKGDIQFPVLGKLHVAGMTTEQLQAELVKRISAEVKDPSVTVEFVNFVVSVAGEVNHPGVIKANGNRLTVLEALSQAGDITTFGKRTDVMLVREENGVRKFQHLDLTKGDILNSPYYYLQPNDYIYVSPTDVRQSNAAYDQMNAYKLQVISTVVSAASVVASMVIALTVK